MNDEIEQWLSDNMPEADCHPVFIGGWEQGARAMAEHLQKKQQPPTRETLEKFLRIAQTWTGGKLNPIIVDYIIEHWNDEQRP